MKLEKMKNTPARCWFTSSDTSQLLARLFTLFKRIGLCNVKPIISVRDFYGCIAGWMTCRRGWMSNTNAALFNADRSIREETAVTSQSTNAEQLIHKTFCQWRIFRPGSGNPIVGSQSHFSRVANSREKRFRNKFFALQSCKAQWGTLHSLPSRLSAVWLQVLSRKPKLMLQLLWYTIYIARYITVSLDVYTEYLQTVYT